MTSLSVLTILNYTLVLLFGFFISVALAGGWKTTQQRRISLLLCPVFLIIQGACWLLLGVESTEKLYPLIIHIPLLLVLTLVMKTRFLIALISVCTAYLCCQIPLWFKMLAATVTGFNLVGEICYTLCIVPVFFLLHRFFAHAAHTLMSHSLRSLLLFGSLPIAYYLFDYLTVVYSDALYQGRALISEFLPTALIMFYLLFLTIYQVQEQEQSETVLQNSLLESELRQAQLEMESLRSAEKQTAIYQHDMRHHFAVLLGYLAAGDNAQASAYIHKVQTGIETITPRRYCENELVNLLCSSFSHKAALANIRMQIEVSAPKHLPLSDTELCAILSNALENALQAAQDTVPSRRQVEFFCGIRHNKFLIEIRNPYEGKIIMQNDLPVSAQAGHGYGCRSIRAVAEKHRGLCSFEAKNGTFIVRVAIPL